MAGPPAYLIAYDVLSFTSALILFITISTAWASKRVYRCKGWFNMMLCWLVYALSWCLLVGKQSSSEPSFGQCYFQTLLIYAAPPLAATATLCFYVDFYLSSCWDLTRRRTLRPQVAWLILLFPWILHLAIDLEVIVISILSKANPVVEKNESNLFCHLHDHNLPSLVNAVIATLVMIILIPLEVWTGIQLFRSRITHQGVEFRRYLSVYIRIAAWTVVTATGFGLSALTFKNADPDIIVEDLVFPCLSMTAALIFASQQDLVDVWLCRKLNLPSLDSSRLTNNRSSELRPPKVYRSNQTLDLEVSGHPPPLQYA